MEWVATLGAVDDVCGDFDHVVGIEADGWVEAAATASLAAAPDWIVMDVFRVMTAGEQHISAGA